MIQIIQFHHQLTLKMHSFSVQFLTLDPTFDQNPKTLDPAFDQNPKTKSWSTPTMKTAKNFISVRPQCEKVETYQPWHAPSQYHTSSPVTLLSAGTNMTHLIAMNRMVLLPSTLTKHKRNCVKKLRHSIPPY